VIVRTLAVGALPTNCYIVGCERTKMAAVIDPGDESDRILKAVQALGLRVRHLLLTHAHFDHMGAADEMVRVTGVPLLVHPDEQPLLDAGGGARFFGFPPPEAPRQVSYLTDGQEVVVGDIRLSVLHTPGHSPGHVCFHAAAQRALFDGDMIFAGGIGRTDLPGSAYDLMMRSIHHLMTLPDDTTIYPGHGPASTIGQERATSLWF
jgi:hydroxyacylglutathione hydrolase